MKLLQFALLLALSLKCIGVVAAAATASGPVPSRAAVSGVKCGFEEYCAWRWNTSVLNGFKVVTSHEANASLTAMLSTSASTSTSTSPATAVRYHGPMADAGNNSQGHFLFLVLAPGTREAQLHNLWSPNFASTRESCSLEYSLYMSLWNDGNFKIVVETVNRTSWVVLERTGNNKSRWEENSIKIGRISQEFNIILELQPRFYRYLPRREQAPLVAIDDIRLKNCFAEMPEPESCTPSQFQCNNHSCIDKNHVCDFINTCENGEDEQQNCDKVPIFSHCDFENGWCGWANKTKQLNGLSLNWTRHFGDTPTEYTGPSFDHTYENASGIYAFVDMSTKKMMGAAAILESAVFNRPPSYHSNSLSAYYNSCHIRFHYHQYGPHSGSLSMSLVELQPKENHTTQLWRIYGDKGNSWFRQVVVLPNITRKYFIQFEARRGIALRGDIALDDISMSPECFGIGVPPEEVKDYDYNRTEPDVSTEEHKDFVNKTYYLLSTCGVEGRYGPNQANCSAAYNNTATRVVVLDKPPLAGVQEWVVPEGGYYTLIAKGAKGGKGSDRKGSSRGASVRTIVELHKGQRVYVLVGQEGTSACSKDLSTRAGVCQPMFSAESNKSSLRPSNPIMRILKMEIEAGGGGGGGGTYVFVMVKDKPVPLLIAGGGGGLGLSQGLDTGRQHGQGENLTLLAITGNIYGQTPAGAGGGWNRNKDNSWHNLTGDAVMQGSRGGFACLGQNGQGWGGYGGGGGGCNAGGGGGGYTGGDSYSEKDASGQGGYSYIGSGDFSQILEGDNDGHGALYIIPAISGCRCDYRCVAMDDARQKIRCLCPANWFLAKDGVSCILPPEPQAPLEYIIAMIIMIFVIILVLCAISMCAYNRYQRKRDERMRRGMLNGPDLQLNRLRETSHSMMTEFNPNYEFGGATYTIQDLKDIPRDHLRLVKALGQGAFGEVYQGFFRHRDGDAVEMPVAVKTLPELSTNQAETDFLMEALIMSKFNHPNIVHFIGVCFDKHPRFIVLELLAGGDLKTFLRESRPKPERPSPLLMRDLLLCSMDVAKGCKYMEDNRFIHRDIAARNCLLTTKGPGRVVKIADFGMARDIYRADYYRKGGKAMLPIKWMPPEAFLDGIFTTKTDVWSFGVLLWEVMSLGYMPYTGCANRDVMQLVTSGGRLEPPSNCPSQLYGIMTTCWHPNPDERPTFSTILERLDYCIQDPEVVNAPLPVFYRPPSSERDMTIMRPSSCESGCLQVQRNADYLVPLPCVLPELPSSPSAHSVDKLLSSGTYDEDRDDWETSFVIPQSRSTQPLLPSDQGIVVVPGGGGIGGGMGGGEIADVPAPESSLVSLDKTGPLPTLNNNNNSRASLKATLSLDPATLGKQPLPYLKVNVASAHLNHAALDPEPGRPYTVHAPSGRHKHSDTEISC